MFKKTELFLHGGFLNLPCISRQLLSGGPEGHVREDPARVQKPGWRGELGQVLRAVPTTSQGEAGCQLWGLGRPPEVSRH